ncbi:MAG TPA: hypothetical protein VGQ42_03390 [Candidatus Dormibacteraeota bacterium]|jgi:hypothetical protein|nr:hypothetical protein [Candidatus Dormibacteraeota bacterium]
MFSSTILTSWAGCPQSRLYHEVVARGDREAARTLTEVARQWDHTLGPRWLARMLPTRLHPQRFDGAGYRPVASRVSVVALEATLEHIEWLRMQDRVRRSLRSVAFLEQFEAVLGNELERRRGRQREWPAAQPWVVGSLSGSSEERRPSA